MVHSKHTAGLDLGEAKPRAPHDETLPSDNQSAIPSAPSELFEVRVPVIIRVAGKPFSWWLCKADTENLQLKKAYE